MNATGSLLERLAPNPAQGPAERGRAWFVDHGLPTGHEEAWKYTPLREVIDVLRSAQPATTDIDAVDRSVVDELAGDHGGPRLVYVNGAFAPAISDIHAVDGLWMGGADELRPRRKPGSPAPQDDPVDGFHALNWAAGNDVAAVLVEPDAHIEVPVHIVHLSVSSGGVGVAHPRTVVRIGRGARLQVIETFAGTGGRSVTNASCRILAGPDSALTYDRVMAESPDSVHIGRTGIEQASNSSVRSTSVITGGEIVRNAIDVHLAGAGAETDLDGLYLPTGGQRHDNVITVDHAASHCRSTQRFKGIVNDHARGSFSGHVIVRPGTVGTDARQSNPNLVLAPTAQADSRPWLEIFADDVRCTHGATVGRLDDEAFFYLRSRGIPAAQARSMLVVAFAAEIIDGIGPSSLHERLSLFVESHTSGRPA